MANPQYGRKSEENQIQWLRASESAIESNSVAKPQYGRKSEENEIQ